ncbi:flagellar biosynthetic protein FliO [Ferrimonas lipolytica]|uniref:Flagellar protein n=1 Tax=Ferrimonas lipolytica TaxID=2724191 RepID=A0A6H1UFE5_9GAMM|nr:flagellar biosynthetic protein FliO [Ferrimonas lipolytica]QIZ77349.1 flagellar biosynthetic protein FliO [Ferrimonas lipolytica]
MSRLLLLLLVAMPASAEPFSAQESYLTMLGSLVGIVALILLLAWLSKRLQLPVAGNGPMKVVATLPLGPKERLLVVQVGEQQHLLSSGAAGTRLLTTLEEPLPVAELPQFGALLDKFKNKQES